MAESPYLIALALIEQGGARALPLAGRSLKADEAVADQPTQAAHGLALELLLRVWQRSDDGVLKRACAGESLLLVELAMERLPEDLPALKAAWLNSGDTAAFKTALQAISMRGWTVSIEKFKPVALQPASLLPVCAVLLVDVSQRMNYQMTKKMDEDDSCQQVSRS